MGKAATSDLEAQGLKRRIAELEAEVARLTPDAERLDFLESLDCGHIEIWYYDGNPNCPQHDPYYGGHWAEATPDPARTLRGEVDFLMTTPPEKWHHNAGYGIGPIGLLKQWWQKRRAARGAEERTDG